MHLLDILGERQLAFFRLPARKRPEELLRTPALDMAELCFQLSAQRLLVVVARDGYHDIFRKIVFLFIVEHILAGKAPDVFRGA